MKYKEYEEMAFAYEDVIWRTIRRNYPLLKALRLELEDVYQDLALTAVQTSRAFDSTRSASPEAHVWMKLQYAILEMKRRHHYVAVLTDEPVPVDHQSVENGG